jgi:prepilin-type N-terminal cleavage/methylation domain-containing protein
MVNSSSRPPVPKTRGFTLLELLVTITLIGILLVLAAPSIAGLMRDRRTNQAAHEAAILYRRARAMAMGRGSAMLIRYTQATRGRLEVREAIGAGGLGQCTNQPATSCDPPTNWANNDPSNRLVATFEPAANYLYDNVSLVLRDGNNNVMNAFDVCFTPLGRVLSRVNTSDAFSPLVQVPYIQAVPVDGAGRTRTVLIVPSGVTRVAL